MLSRRFDRDGTVRIPFLSAMAMMGAKDGERGSYPEIVDALAEHSAKGKKRCSRPLSPRRLQCADLQRRRSPAQSRLSLARKAGWSLSPAYSLNTVPIDVKVRVLTTNINLDEGTCSIDLLEEASEFFALTLAQARVIMKEVATVTATWRETAKAFGDRSAEIKRMAGAFEHDDLKRALVL